MIEILIIFGERADASKLTVPEMSSTSRRALITFLVVFQVCKVLRRSRVSSVLKCHWDNLISEQRPKWVGTLTGESCVFGLAACLDRSQRGQTRSALSTALPHLASQEQLQSNKQCVA